MSIKGQLAGKRAFVLGAGAATGMGAATARRFKEEGAQVVIGGRDPAKLEAVAAEIGGVGVVRLDIVDAASIRDGIEAATKAMGGLDIAVNAAGVSRAAVIADETEEGLLTQARIHFIGTALFIKEAAARMGPGSSIVTISSLTAELTTTRVGAYAATKAAADKVVQIAAVEYGEKGIRINSIAPGFTRTPMTAGYYANEKAMAAFLRETPRGKLSEPEDVAAAALWLASDGCVATGDLIRVSGGMHLRRMPIPADYA